MDAKIHDLIIRKTHATICLAGKGNKLRIVPISPSVVELLKTYLDKAHPTEQRQSDDYLFFTTHHGRKNRMSSDAVNLSRIISFVSADCDNDFLSELKYAPSVVYRTLYPFEA